MADERIEVQRTIPAEPAAIFAVLCDPKGHVAIDSSGMLMSAEGRPVKGRRRHSSSCTWTVRRSTTTPWAATTSPSPSPPSSPTARSPGPCSGQIRPQIGHVYGYRLEPVDGGTLATSYYDWSAIDPTWKEAGIFPVISEGALRATLGILDRTVVPERPEAPPPG